MAATVNTLDTALESAAAAQFLAGCGHFLAGCGKLVPVLIVHEAGLPRWDREDPDATALFVVCPPSTGAP